MNCGTCSQSYKRTAPTYGWKFNKATSLQECKNLAMVAYAHLPNGPIFCQHVTHVEMIDVYGNARPVE